MALRCSRRRFLGLAGGATAAIATGVPLELLRGQDGAPRGTAADPVARLGRVYLRSEPDEGTVDALFDRVPGLTRRRPVLEQLPDLQGRVTADFARQRTVSVAGWRLARTEARVAALHALGR